MKKNVVLSIRIRSSTKELMNKAIQKYNSSESLGELHQGDFIESSIIKLSQIILSSNKVTLKFE